MIYESLKITGHYKDEYHHENEFSLILPIVSIAIQFDSSNKITNVISTSVQGSPDVVMDNEKLKKCISGSTSLLDQLAMHFANIQLMGIP